MTVSWRVSWIGFLDSPARASKSGNAPIFSAIRFAHAPLGAFWQASHMARARAPLASAMESSDPGQCANVFFPSKQVCKTLQFALSQVPAPLHKFCLMQRVSSIPAGATLALVNACPVARHASEDATGCGPGGTSISTGTMHFHQSQAGWPYTYSPVLHACSFSL